MAEAETEKEEAVRGYSGASASDREGVVVVVAVALRPSRGTRSPSEVHPQPPWRHRSRRGQVCIIMSQLRHVSGVCEVS